MSPGHDPRRDGLTRRETLQRAITGGLLLSSGGLLAACGGSGSGAAKATATAAAGAAARRGGTLRVGISGGADSDTLDVHKPLIDTDIARNYQLYEPLVRHDADYKLQMLLAESIEPGKTASEWTVRLRDGVMFHDGKPVTADDVIFSIARIVDPKDPKRGAGGLVGVTKGGMHKLDKRTVRFKLSQANSEFPTALGEYYNGIVPVGYDPKQPVGTGPFKYVSFTPGQQSEFTRFDDYWQSGQPYLDKVVITDIGDDTARVNALLGGQVDAINNLPFSQIAQVKAGNHQVLSAETGNWIPFTMRTNAAPFNDVNVRQAMRLLVDRKQMLDQSLGGQATPANDLFARYDPAYNSDLPQRERDVEQAKSLLAKAGKSGLTVELVTSDVTVGVVSAAEVFAQQAKDAGVTVKLRKVSPTAFYGDNFLKWPFAQDYWFVRGYLDQVSQSMLPSASANETHFDDKRYQSLYTKARGELDTAKRTELIHEMQKIEYDTGGYIIPSFNNQVDAMSSAVKGLVPAKTGVPLGNYNFAAVSLAG